MKKLFVISLLALFAGLCACERTAPEATTTSTTSSKGESQVTTDDTATQEGTTSEATNETPVVSASSTTTNRTGESSSTVIVDASVIALYTKALEAYYAISPASLLAGAEYYTFYDIDGNGAVELLLAQQGGWAYEGLHLCCIYTIQNNKAVQQKTFWTDFDSGPPPLVFKNGTVRTQWYDTSSYKDFCYFRFEDEELKFQAKLSDHVDGYFRNNVFRGGGNTRFQITKEEYERYTAEFEGDGQVVELDWTPLAEYGR